MYNVERVAPGIAEIMGPRAEWLVGWAPSASITWLGRRLPIRRTRATYQTIPGLHGVACRWLVDPGGMLVGARADQVTLVPLAILVESVGTVTLGVLPVCSQLLSSSR